LAHNAAEKGYEISTEKKNNLNVNINFTAVIRQNANGKLKSSPTHLLNYVKASRRE